jgi:hypothetical protein
MSGDIKTRKGWPWLAIAMFAIPSAHADDGLSELLKQAGITASGYLDASFSYFDYAGDNAPRDYNSFLFQQAGFTLARQPSSGAGARIDVVATPYDSIYVDNYATDRHFYLSDGTAPGAPRVFIYQGYAQYAIQSWTLIAGKFTSICGVENYPATVNPNVTRSLLYTFEPITHTGVRATYAQSPELSFVIGLNNGLTGQADESASSSDKVLELSMNMTPSSKLFAWSLQGYYGRDISDYGSETDIFLLDTVFTWNFTPSLTGIFTADYSAVDHTARAPAASWWGVGAYLTYSIDPQWRTALRLEYVADRDGYLSLAPSASYARLVQDSGIAFPRVDEGLKEGTLTLGFAPEKHLELRLEARYDAPDRIVANAAFPRTTQLWLEALYKFGL